MRYSCLIVQWHPVYTGYAPIHSSCLPAQAVRPDELDIQVDEELEVLDWDDGDGWCKGKNRAGLEGFFPRSYVQPSSRSSSPPTGHAHTGSQDSGQLLNSNHSNGNGDTTVAGKHTCAHVMVNGIGLQNKRAFNRVNLHFYSGHAESNV